MSPIIQQDRSLIVACDVQLYLHKDLLRATADLDCIGAYKIGFSLGLEYGLPYVVMQTKHYTSKPIIYDHQKAGTDIPDTGKAFARTMKRSGVDAVIFFPQAGPETEKAWIEAAFEQDLGVIVGGLMTHQKYLRSEGGYIADAAILEMYLTAAALGVSDFVVPGNRPDSVWHIRQALEEQGISPTFYSPGFVAQGGLISAAAKVVGERWHAIVGRGIYEAADMRQAAVETAKGL